MSIHHTNNKYYLTNNPLSHNQMTKMIHISTTRANFRLFLCPPVCMLVRKPRSRSITYINFKPLTLILSEILQFKDLSLIFIWRNYYDRRP